jgi:hypothetical protein
MKEAFSRGIIPAIAFTAHAADKLVLIERFLVKL